MIIVDTALQKRARSGNPIKVGLAGAGFMGRGIINQIHNYSPGIQLVAVYSRDSENAKQACVTAGIEKIRFAENSSDIEQAIQHNECAITDNAGLLAQADEIEVLVDATGAVEFGANFAAAAIQHGKHLVMMNA